MRKVICELEGTVCQLENLYGDELITHKQIGGAIDPKRLNATIDKHLGIIIFHKPTSFDQMKAFLWTLDIGRKTNIHRPLIEHGWAKDTEEAEALLNQCGWGPTGLCSENGWEPGIT